QKIEDVEKIVKNAVDNGTDAFMVGGSSSTVVVTLDDTIKKIKENSELPVILFPHSHAGISRYADAIFFMSLLNSRNISYIVEEQIKGAPLVKIYNLEPIPMGYLMFESGDICASQYVSDAKLIPNRPEIAVAYSLTAQYFGMKLVYLEAGSGAEYPVSDKIISAVKENVNIPIIVGGGIKDKETAKEKLDAGADILVTGTINEGNLNKMGEIIKEIKLYQ
ncbi:MAG: geranylgeranylglyceryl/heptaprenylglyceryl phosphate synthase, partial [Candidatus Aenigmarchaeota archaeon ex4484_56]